MKRFDFKLKKVRDWTDTRRQIEESKLESLLNDVRRLDEEYERTSSQCGDFSRQLYQQELIDAASLAALNEFRQFVVREKRRVERVRVELNHQIETQRGLITEVKRKIALFDKLQETQKAAWQMEADRELQELADESVASRVNRSRRR